MLVVTTENPPPGYRIADVFSMIELDLLQTFW
jgi:hypothetical protein